MARNTTSGASANVVAMQKSNDDLAEQRDWKRDTPPMEPRGPGQVLAGQWLPDLYGMPSDPGCECPVIPIGFEGALFYLIDSRGQFRAVKAAEMNQAGIQDLFAKYPNYPKWMHPRWSKPVVDKKGIVTRPAEIVSFEADEIKETLFRACARMGFFSPENKMRGRGAWTFRSGAIAYHGGDAIWITQKGKFTKLPTGIHQGHLYPRLAPLPRPWTEPIGLEESPARKLLLTFRKWNWTRPKVDPVLLLGWIGCAMIGGALDWRSAILLLGDRSTGKSTLQSTLLRIFGDALMQSADPTAAYIYQKMAHDSRPVALDELEPDGDPRKVANMVHLMRTSASGAIGGRGGPTKGEASEFQMRSAFLFSAINNPVRSAQDLSRIAVLRLQALDLNQERPEPIDEETTGPMVLALMLQGWGENGHKFRSTFNRFKTALAEGGHGGRGQDTYGTLLACAAIMMGDELAAELGVPLREGEELEWAEADMLKADSLPEVEDAAPNYRQCVDQILTRPVKAWRLSTRNTIGQTLEEIRTVDPVTGEARPDPLPVGTAKKDINIAGFGLFNVREIVAGVMRRDRITLEAALMKYGLPAAGMVLAVPNRSVKVQEHLEGSDWQYGAWKDALRQCAVPGVMITHADINKQTIDGTQTRCTLIVLDKYHEAPEK